MNFKNIIIKTLSVIALATACTFSFAETPELTESEQMIVLDGLRADNYFDKYWAEKDELTADAIYWVSNGIKYMKIEDEKKNARLDQIDQEYQRKYEALVQQVKSKR